VPWDEAAFATAIVRLLKDPEMAVRMGEQGRRYVLERRTYARIADSVEATLRHIAGGRP
jgi:glycosyltransferase involved in cell wall biosynthesis